MFKSLFLQIPSDGARSTGPSRFQFVGLVIMLMLQVRDVDSNTFKVHVRIATIALQLKIISSVIIVIWTDDALVKSYFTD